MASDYGLNFGFRRSDESVRTSEGRLRTPATGSPLQLGTVVEIDPAAAGFLRVGGSGVKPRAGVCGLLVQEEIWDRSIYGPEMVDSYSLGIALLNRLSVITTGAGTKVWFQNTTGFTQADGRVIPSVAMFVATSVAVGHGLAWNGTAFINVTDPTDPTAFGEVTFYDSTNAYVEMVLSH